MRMPLQPASDPRRGLTLVELLVATALGSILIGIVTFVWMQSNKIFTVTINRLETYQRLRTVLDVVERDLANTNRTADMEFYVPGPGANDGHYDPGTGDTPLMVDGQSFRVPNDPRDPLFGTPEGEFGLPGFSATAPYLFAPVILSPPPYTIAAGYTEGRAYWRDEVYVRTFASVQGVNRPALVHYRLVQGGDERSLLRRRVWYLNEDGQMVPVGTPGLEPTDRTSILSHGMADLKIGFYFKRSPIQGEGDWYHVGKIGAPYADQQQALLEQDEERGFRDPNKGAYALSAQHSGSGQFGGLNAVSFHYEGNGRFEQTQVGPVLFRSLSRDTDVAAATLEGMADLSHYDNFGFDGVRPGDQFYVYDAIDDDAQQAPGAPKAAGPRFPNRLFTVESIAADQSKVYTAVKFQEPINFYRLVSTWLGDETDLDVKLSDLGSPGSTTYLGGPPRRIQASFNVRFRVAFLPAAFVVRLSCDDRFNRRVLPMERVIRLLQQ